MVTGGVLSAAAAVAMMTTAAQAARPQITPSVVIEDASGGSPAAPAPRVSKYCLADTKAGTRLQKLVCRTAAEWKTYGVDIKRTR